MNVEDKQGKIDWDKVLSRGAIVYFAIETMGIVNDFHARPLNDGLSDPDFFTLSFASNAVLAGSCVLGMTSTMVAADHLARKNRPVLAGLTLLAGTTASIYGGAVLKSYVDSHLPKTMHHKQDVSSMNYRFKENTDAIQLPESTISYAAAKAQYALT